VRPVVGDLVVQLPGGWTSDPPGTPRWDVGQVVHQTDIMSTVCTHAGTVRVRTATLEVVQPAHPGEHNSGLRR
jgi:hypothetical protein